TRWPRDWSSDVCSSDLNLILQGTNGSLGAGHCVNGIAGSIFGQFSYCNAPAFFQAANQAIQAGKLVPPPLGKARDGLACPTVREIGRASGREREQRPGG